MPSQASTFPALTEEVAGIMDAFTLPHPLPADYEPERDTLADATADLKQWLDRMANACAAEVRALDRTGNVADGDLLREWTMLLESVERFREAQMAAMAGGAQ